MYIGSKFLRDDVWGFNTNPSGSVATEIAQPRREESSWVIPDERLAMRIDNISGITHRVGADLPSSVIVIHSYIVTAHRTYRFTGCKNYGQQGRLGWF